MGRVSRIIFNLKINKISGGKEMEKQLFKRVTAAVTTLAVAAGMNIAVFADNL